MAKSKKRSPCDGAMTAIMTSPNGIESDVSAAGNSPPSMSSTPIKHGPTTSTPIQNGSNKNDDPSTWSKSKKKRMRAKRRKEAAKNLIMAVGGSDANSMNGIANRPRKQSTPDNVIDGKSETSPSKHHMSGGEDDEGKSKKRLRKNPAEPPSAAVANGTSDDSNSAATEGPKTNKRNLNTLKAMKGHNSTRLDLDGSNAKKSPSNSNQKYSMECHNSSEVYQSGDCSSPKKKRKKKKKKNSDTPNSTTQQAQKPTLKSVQNAKDSANNNINSFAGNEKTKANSMVKPATQKLKISLPKLSQMSTLQKAFLERLTSSRFRELNEELYTHSSQHSFEHFTNNPELFDQYHVGFRKQVKEWPVNPVDVIYKKIVKEYSSENTKEKGERPGRKVVVADFGCGDAKLAERLLALRIGNDGQTLTQASTRKKKSHPKEQFDLCPFKVFSFDLVSGGNPLVTPADMANVPLPNESVDVGSYCLALMGTNVADFVREAWRVLKFNGVLKVAEVRSRFETAAAAGQNENKGGGKRVKLNNKLKQSKRIQKKDSFGSDNAPKPLMLLDEFISLMERCGFECTNKDQLNKMFLFMDFIKRDGSKGLSEVERFTAKPCIYKRR